MAQQEIEMILFRQLASYLAMPVFLVDPVGNLVFYNESAERILGLRYEETGEMPVDEWSTVFVPCNELGEPLPAEALPLVQTMQTREPAHGNFWITGLDGVRRGIRVTALPIIGQRGRDLGSAAIFWEGG